MEDPKRQAWMYVIAGAVAIVAAIFFLTSAPSQTGDFSLLDWAILGMGVVAVFRGVKMFRNLGRDSVAPPEPGESTTFRRKATPPKDDKPSKDA